MSRFVGGRLGLIVLSVVSLAIAAALVVNWRERTRVHRVTIAAGSRTGESYLLGQALKTVTGRHHPNIELTILETGGTAESMALLEEGRVTMDAEKAGVAGGTRARS